MYKYGYCKTITNNEKRKLLYNHMYRLHDEIDRSKIFVK